jgi:hypothetical protein
MSQEATSHLFDGYSVKSTWMNPTHTAYETLLSSKEFPFHEKLSHISDWKNRTG